MDYYTRASVTLILPLPPLGPLGLVVAVHVQGEALELVILVL